MIPTPPAPLFRIRPVQTDDWPAVRQVIIHMLTDAPYAFGETLSEAQDRPDEAWQHWVRQLADGSQQRAFLAEDGLGVCGFVRGDTTMPQLPPNSALVGQLWVAPHQRGTGLGIELMAAVTNWVKQLGLGQIFLGVTDSNLRVLNFYNRLGYQDTGMRFEVPGRESRQIIIMLRPLPTS